MVRGGPVRRTRDVRVRLTPDEHAAWSAARAVTGRRELSAGVQVTVDELLSLPAGERPGRLVEREQVVDVEAYPTLVTAANALYGLAARGERGAVPGRAGGARGLPGGPRRGGRDPRGDRGRRPTCPGRRVIATIHKGASFSHAAKYLFGPGENGEHVDPRVLTGGQVLLGNPRGWRDWVADMRFCASLRTDVARPVWHCSLRAAPKDPVLEDAERMVREMAAGGPSRPGWFQYAIEHRADRAQIADVGANLHENLMQAELGFTIAPRYQGKGLGSQAVLGVLARLFHEQGRQRVSAECDARNTASAALLHKVALHPGGAAPAVHLDEGRMDRRSALRDPGPVSLPVSPRRPGWRR